MKIDMSLTVTSLKEKLKSFWNLAGKKAIFLEERYDTAQGSPVYTVNGTYTSRGWTEWTQGFQYGIPLLIAEALGDLTMLELGKRNTIANMAHHVSHFGVHDHGFNNLSTYGNLLRLAGQGILKAPKEEKDYYRLALCLSGAVQAKRWSEVQGGGYIYSFNGPHSLFIDTIRTCRVLLVAHRLGHRMMDENDREIDLLQRALVHGTLTAEHAVYYGKGRDRYDVRGRVAHESIFNMNDGHYRCPGSQQGFSGFTTWTRGLAWAMLGFSEFLEFLEQLDGEVNGLERAKQLFLEAARATCDFYIEHTALDGIPYWDTGAPDLHRLGDYRDRPAMVHNDFEPIDSSAAAIGAQGLIRLGNLLKRSEPQAASTYRGAGFTVLRTLLGEAYLAREPEHQGILKHSVYHRPNGWDHIPNGKKVPAGESSMWGDYHMVELCLLAHKMATGEYYTFFDQL